jgi:hypothetical protein
MDEDSGMIQGAIDYCYESSRNSINNCGSPDRVQRRQINGKRGSPLTWCKPQSLARVCSLASSYSSVIRVYR